MANLNFDLTLKGRKQFEKAIVDEISKQLDFSKLSQAIKVGAIQLVESSLVESQTWKELLGGQLRKDLGLENPGPVLNNILRVILNHVQVKHDLALTTKGGNPVVSGNITLLIELGDFSDILNIPGASYVSTSFTRGRMGVKTTIEWVKWLLFEGHRTLIFDFQLVQDDDFFTSRTRDTLMIRWGGASFRINPNFAGTVNDNFITRAIIAKESVFLDMIKQKVDRFFRAKGT